MEAIHQIPEVILPEGLIRLVRAATLVEDRILLVHAAILAKDQLHLVVATPTEVLIALLEVLVQEAATLLALVVEVAAARVQEAAVAAVDVDRFLKIYK